MSSLFYDPYNTYNKIAVYTEHPLEYITIEMLK